jgi:hypothetical protein
MVVHFHTGSGLLCFCADARKRTARYTVDEACVTCRYCKGLLEQRKVQNAKRA